MNKNRFSPGCQGQQHYNTLFNRPGKEGMSVLSTATKGLPPGPQDVQPHIQNSPPDWRDLSLKGKKDSTAFDSK